ncbi:hypothetical protein LCGC14_1533640 [marine sediment metagenome]|uniref:Uncharacterized protein n=1 Tax=marine sediment metagenome TaxID=412755 RepID=A0A0F9IV77_9ZZZZ
MIVRTIEVTPERRKWSHEERVIVLEFDGAKVYIERHGYQTLRVRTDRAALVVRPQSSSAITVEVEGDYD